MAYIDKFNNIVSGTKNDLPIGSVDQFGNVRIGGNSFTGARLDSFGNFIKGNMPTGIRTNEFGTIVNSSGLPATKSDFEKL